MNPTTIDPERDAGYSKRNGNVSESGGRQRYYYRVFGRTLASGLVFPELHPIRPQAPVWSFEVVDRTSTGGELLGEEPLYKDVSARLLRHVRGYRVEVDDTGSYDLTSNGSEIGWKPLADPWLDFGRGHFLGRVLSTALHFSGSLVLHGSAVETAQGVVAFLGEKGAGKTTLALSVVGRGARLVADDAVAITPNGECLVQPGVQSVRLKPDAPDLGLADVTTTARGRDGKLTTRPIDSSRVMAEPSPLRAVYLVQPVVSSDPDHVLHREKVDEARAAACMAGFAKIGRMLGAGEAGTLLRRAGAVAQAVTVGALFVHRSVDDLSRVAEQILEWHGAP